MLWAAIARPGECRALTPLRRLVRISAFLITGIVGVITGFGSICIDGNEGGLDGAVPMRIDGNTAPGTALRAGPSVNALSSSAIATPAVAGLGCATKFQRWSIGR